MVVRRLDQCYRGIVWVELMLEMEGAGVSLDPEVLKHYIFSNL